ncbi:MAG TPA: NADP-specific glutamate dehydrogenase [Gemmatimonadota bacterium]|nr:NADP-specific glutamate dehydrogenase [Gemmatimonadota bacterium]
MDAQAFMDEVEQRNPGEPEFHQAVREFVDKVWPFIEQNPEYRENGLLERLVEPDRMISFRVTWVDDHGRVRVDRGHRVQFNNSLGPYKGGLRFDPSVNVGLLKFLGFEQTFKNALTMLSMGGAKGGSDFDPKGKSEGEIMRFCQAFMTELHRHIGRDLDVPAGDIGVGSREIGYLFGQYKRVANEWAGVLTGKAFAIGGSRIRTEATGYGAVYFAEEMLARRGEGLEGKTCAISGSGNVAQYAAQKLIEAGAVVVTLSDRGGFVHEPDGLSAERLEWVIEQKPRGAALLRYGEEFGAAFHAGERPWKVPCDLAFPCATQNEIRGEDAEDLIASGCRAVVEGANMPATYQASKRFEAARVLHAPGKAANAGGVAISGMEMTQNAMRLRWTREEVDARLRAIMSDIHRQCVEYGDGDGDWIDYVQGANLAGFLRVARAMRSLGVV